MIIDSHCHAGAGFGLTDPWSRRPLLDNYLRRAQQAGITHSVLFANFDDDYALANRIVARLVHSNRRRFFGFCYVHAQRDRGRIFEMVRTAVEEYGFVGIKAHRHDATITSEICDAARAFTLPVLYDVENELRIVDWLARDYPDLPFVIPHLGSFGENWRAQTAFLERLERYPSPAERASPHAETLPAEPKRRVFEAGGAALTFDSNVVVYRTLVGRCTERTTGSVSLDLVRDRCVSPDAPRPARITPPLPRSRPA